jgi:hypothetical protein
MRMRSSTLVGHRTSRGRATGTDQAFLHVEAASVEYGGRRRTSR